MAQEIRDTRLIAFAILGYIFCFFGWQLPLILVVAYALAINKEPALGKQTLQALYLYIAYQLVIKVIGWVFTGFLWFADTISAYGFYRFLGDAHGVIVVLLGLALLLLVLLAILRLMKKQACHLPIVGHLADLTLGLATPKAKPAPAYQAPYTPPVAPAAPTQPAAPAAPTAPAAPAQPVAPAAPATPAAPAVPQTAAPSGLWTCSNCGHENKGKFCVSCGKPQNG